MADVEFIDNTMKVKQALADVVQLALEEAAGELQSQVVDNTAVDTGDTRNSWTHHVTGSVMTGEYKATVGSPMENAIWEEFGTGEYALNGDGRKGGWFYEDEKGVGHFTHGKHPRRPFHKAYTTTKNKLIRIIQNRIKGGLS